MLVGTLAGELGQVDSALSQIASERTRLDQERLRLLSRRTQLLAALTPQVPSAGMAPARPEMHPKRAQNILLSLGSALLAISALIFLAVTWSLLGEAVQAAVLVAVTAGVGAGGLACGRRGLGASQAALGSLMLALGVADVWAARSVIHIDGNLHWGLGLALVAGLGVTYGRRSKVVNVVGWLLIGPATWAGASGLDDAPSIAVVLGIVAAGLGALAYRSGGSERVAQLIGAGLLGTSGYLVSLVERDAGGRTSSAVIAGLALVGCGWWAWRRGSRAVAALASLAFGLMLGGTAGSALGWAFGVALGAAASALVVAVARAPGRVPGFWRGLEIGALVSSGIAAMFLLIPGAALARIWLDIRPDAGQDHDLALGALISVALGGTWLAARWPGLRGLGVGALMGASASCAALIGGGPAGVGAAVLIGAGLAWVSGTRADTWITTYLGIVGLAWAWESAGALKVIVVGLLCVGVVLRLRLGSRLDAVLSVLSVGALGVQIADLLAGARHSYAGVLVALGALVALGSALWGRRSSRLRVGFEIGAALVSVAALVLASDSSEWSAAVLAAAGLSLVALSRARGRMVGYAGSALVSLGWWVLLGGQDVDTPEYYTLPVSALMLGIGYYRRRGGAGSWSAYGSALGMGLVPSLAHVLGRDDTLRALTLLGASGAIALVGGWFKLRAPLVVGGVVAVVVAFDQSAPYLADVPRWAGAGVIGALLLGLGVTFDARRRDARRLSESYHRME